MRSGCAWHGSGRVCVQRARGEVMRHAGGAGQHGGGARRLAQIRGGVATWRRVRAKHGHGEAGQAEVPAVLACVRRWRGGEAVPRGGGLSGEAVQGVGACEGAACARPRRRAERSRLNGADEGSTWRRRARVCEGVVRAEPSEARRIHGKGHGGSVCTRCDCTQCARRNAVEALACATPRRRDGSRGNGGVARAGAWLERARA